MRQSKILLKLVDAAVLPALLLASVKITASLFALFFLKIPFSFNLIFGFPTIAFNDPSDFLKINNFSGWASLLFLSLILSLIILRAYFFNNSHISPNLTIRILDLNLGRLVDNSFNLFSQTIIWLSFLWLTSLAIFVSFFLQTASLGLAVTSFTLCLIFTFLLILNLEREIAPSNSRL